MLTNNVRPLLSLGLIYRTRSDIDAGVKIVTKDLKQYFDVTVPVNSALNKAGEEAKKHPLDTEWFVSKVDNFKPWDVKREKSWIATIKTMYPGRKDATVYYYGMKTSPEGIGNLMYGYVGTAAMYPPTVLYGAGGMVQQGGTNFTAFKKAFNDGPPYWGDTFEDHTMIKLGIILYSGGGVD